MEGVGSVSNLFGPRFHEISTAELQSRLEKGERLTIIDVREPSEYAEGHVPGALLRPLGHLATWAGELDKESEILVICRSGNRSGMACRQLAAMGFTRQTNVAGGMLAWQGKVER
jgi:rhodanese-related sulfurtransferase